MTAAEEVKVLGMWASPYVMRARIALNIKGVRYEYIEEEDVLGSKSELLLESNPIYKKVPVLIHAGNPVCESMIIVQYIDDVWGAVGPNILPSNPCERASARFWAVYLDDKWFPILIDILKGKTEEARAEAAEQAISGMQLLEEVFKKSCNERRFFGGDTIGYLDIFLGCFLVWIKAAEEMASVKLLDEAKIPVLVGWAERFSSDDAVRGVTPEISRLVEHCKILQTTRWNSKATN